MILLLNPTLKSSNLAGFSRKHLGTLLLMNLLKRFFWSNYCSLYLIMELFVTHLSLSLDYCLSTIPYNNYQPGIKFITACIWYGTTKICRCLSRLNCQNTYKVLCYRLQVKVTPLQPKRTTV